MARKRTNRRRLDRQRRTHAQFNAAGSSARRALPYLLAGIVALGLPYGIFHAYLHVVSSPSWDVQTIDVQGNAWSKAPDLITHAQLMRGVNIFDVDLAHAAGQLESHPWVKTATVERELPDTLHIRITEHEPVALIVDDQGMALVDASGDPFKSLDASDPTDALVGRFHIISGTDRTRLDAGHPDHEAERAHLTEAFSALRTYYSLSLQDEAQLSEIHVDPVVGLSFVLEQGGVEVRLGWGRYTERLTRFSKVYESLVEKDIQVDYILIDQDKDLSRVAVGLAMAKDGTK